MCRGRQANDDESCFGITETGYGLPPVVPFSELPFPDIRDVLAVLAEARAPVAGDDRPMDLVEGRILHPGRD
jgi:hypothetical protein